MTTLRRRVTAQARRAGVCAGLAFGLLAWAAPTGALLPPKVQSPPNATQRNVLNHLLAAKFPAAWNAKSLAKASQAPTVLIADFWGNGKPPNLFSGKNYINAAIVGGQIDPNPNDLTPNDHGYHVTGIVFGSFANDGTSKGLVTGAFTPRGKLHAVDGQNDASLWHDNEKFLQSINSAVQSDPRGNVVVNTSLSDEPDEDGAEAVKWIKRVRELGLEDKYFHTTAAGNDGADGAAGSESTWSAAAVRDDLNDNGTPVPHLTNTLSVENVVESTDAARLGCLHSSSNSGGSVAAPGTDVRSFNSSGLPINQTGTSMASPVVAGLAAYLWSIAPDLTPQQLVSAITKNAQPGPDGSCDRTSAPLLDAYQATLSLDQPGAPTIAGYPVRMKILDVNNSGGFNDQDLETLAKKLDDTLNPSVPNWSRHDLNGDGFTGGARTAPFDLDRTSSTRAGTSSLGIVQTSFDGTQVQFAEQAVTDRDVLCFYAHSPLFTGSAAVRTKLCPAPLATFENAVARINNGSCNEAGCQRKQPGDSSGFTNFTTSFIKTVSTSKGGAKGTTSQATKLVRVGRTLRSITSTAKSTQSGPDEDESSGGRTDLDIRFNVPQGVSPTLTITLTVDVGTTEVDANVCARSSFSLDGPVVLLQRNVAKGAASSCTSTAEGKATLSQPVQLVSGSYILGLQTDTNVLHRGGEATRAQSKWNLSMSFS